MKHATRWILSLAMVAAGAAAPTVHADDVESYFIRSTANRFFPTYQNTRSMSMGGTFVGIKGDSASVLGNPAGLGFVDGHFWAGGFQFEQISGDDPSTLDGVDQDIYRGLLLGAYSVTEDFTLGLGFVPSFAESDDSADTDSDTFYVPLSAAYKVSPLLAIGYGIGYVNDETDGSGFEAESDFGLLHRLGLMYDVSETVDLGLMGTFGHGDTDSSAVNGTDYDGDLESWSIQGGIAWQATDPLLLALDLGYEEMENDGTLSNSLIPLFPSTSFDESIDVLSVRAGAEYAWNECLDLRGGVGYTDYDYETSDAATAALVDSLDGVHVSGGFGYEWSENWITDVGGMVRFFDEVDFLVGGQVTYNF